MLFQASNFLFSFPVDKWKTKNKKLPRKIEKFEHYLISIGKDSNDG